MKKTSIYKSRNNLSSSTEVVENYKNIELWREKWNISQLQNDFFDKELSFIEENKNREIPSYNENWFEDS